MKKILLLSLVLCAVSFTANAFDNLSSTVS